MWPESATPLPFEQDIVGGSAIRRLAVESKATLLIGSDQVEPIKTAAPGEKAQTRYYNAAFLVKPDGTVGAVYRKMHLVPFGEYVPLQSVLFFAGPIIGAVADFSSFTPGTVPVLLPVGDHIGQHRDLLRGDLPESDPAVRPRRQRAADDDHQRRVVRRDRLPPTSTGTRRRCARSRRGDTSRARPTPGSAASSIPTAASSRRRRCSSRRSSSQDIRFITDRTIYSRIGDLVAWLSLALTAAALLAAWRVR